MGVLGGSVEHGGGRGGGEIKNILMYQNTGTGLGSSAGGLSSEHL